MIHWIRKRVENSAWPRKPTITHQNSPQWSTRKIEKTRLHAQASVGGDDLDAARLLAPLDQPHHADEVVDPDQRPAEVGVVRPPGVPLGVRHVDVQRPPAVAGDQRRQVAVHVVEVRQPEEDVAADHLQPAAGVAGVVLEQPLRGCRWPPSRPSASRRCPGARRAARRSAPRPRGSAAPSSRATSFADLGGRVLAVAVEGADHPRRGRSRRRCGSPPTGRRWPRAAPGAASG